MVVLLLFNWVSEIQKSCCSLSPHSSVRNKLAYSPEGSGLTLFPRGCKIWLVFINKLWPPHRNAKSELLTGDSSLHSLPPNFKFLKNVGRHFAVVSPPRISDPDSDWSNPNHEINLIRIRAFSKTGTRWGQRTRIRFTLTMFPALFLL